MNSLQDNLWTKNVALCEKNRENQKPLNTLFYCLYFTSQIRVMAQINDLIAE